MNVKLAKLIWFAVGASAGSFITYRILRAKYDERLRVEVESVRRAYNTQNELEKPREKAPTEYQAVEIVEAKHEQEVEREKLKDILLATKYVAEVAAEERDLPYAIPQEDIGIERDYGEIVLHFFSDDVLTDDDWEPLTVDEIRESIGLNWKDYIGSYGDRDITCFCNDAKMLYYTVYYDERVFAETCFIPGFREI